ncbi:MAG: carbon monoxide dehydrogenase subunit G [Rhodobacter sp.]|nr:carbon monoxide dehydrogenase subunit G [Paracoccaceae bacterium]MCC0076248.1 carbon monoxide dehydrogenase subunit G [Rhodobacter sp.]
MKLEGSFPVSAPRSAVWEAIRDPGLMARCVPGCSMAEQIDETSYRAMVTVKFGPITARFNLVVEIEEEIAPELVRSRTRGEEGTRASTVSSTNILTLSEPEPGITQVDWSTDFTISGRLGKYGLGLMKKKVESLSTEFVQTFAAKLEEGTEAERGTA